MALNNPSSAVFKNWSFIIQFPDCKRKNRGWWALEDQEQRLALSLENWRTEFSVQVARPHGLKKYKKLQLSFNSNTFPLRLLVPIPTTGLLIFNFIVQILWALALEIFGWARDFFFCNEQYCTRCMNLFGDCTVSCATVYVCFNINAHIRPLGQFIFTSLL